MIADNDKPSQLENIDFNKRSDLQLLERMFREMWGTDNEQMQQVKEYALRRLSKIVIDENTPQRNFFMAMKVLDSILKYNLEILAKQLPHKTQELPADQMPVHIYLPDNGRDRIPGGNGNGES